jgi:hypothetical protein
MRGFAGITGVKDYIKRKFLFPAVFAAILYKFPVFLV